MINVKRYDINYTQYVKQRIPNSLRNPIIIALALIFVLPVVYIFNALLNFRTLCLYKLKITPQVVYLEKMLNDRYDFTARRIYITDGKEYAALILFTKAEGKKTLLFTKAEAAELNPILYEKKETSQFAYDFVVNIPAAVGFNMNELIQLVKNYKLASKDFKIQIR